MGFFDQFNTTAEAVSTNPFFVPTNDYNVAITAAENKTFSDIPYLMIDFTIADGSHAGKKASTMLRLIPWTQAERAAEGDYETMNMRLLSSYKKTLLELGIAEAMLNQFDPRNPQHLSKLLGIRGTGRIETKGDYTNIDKFQRTVAASETAAPMNSPAPVAAGPVEAAPNQAALDSLLSGFGG